MDFVNEFLGILYGSPECKMAVMRAAVLKPLKCLGIRQVKVAHFASSVNQWLVKLIKKEVQCHILTLSLYAFIKLLGVKYLL